MVEYAEIINGDEWQRKQCLSPVIVPLATSPGYRTAGGTYLVSALSAAESLV